jgi:hypothetical protein
MLSDGGMGNLQHIIRWKMPPLLTNYIVDKKLNIRKGKLEWNVTINIVTGTCLTNVAMRVMEVSNTQPLTKLTVLHH